MIRLAMTESLRYTSMLDLLYIEVPCALVRCADLSSMMSGND